MGRLGAQRHHPLSVNRTSAQHAILCSRVCPVARQTRASGEIMLNGILNVIWLVLEGIWMAIGYVIAGIICFILIITIPFGIASFRIAGYVLWPFGRTVERQPSAGIGSMIGNVLWVILFGWWLAIGHLVAGALLMLTIIGI